MRQMVNLFTEPLIGEHGYLFSGNELGNNFCSSITDDPGGRPSKSWTLKGEVMGKFSKAFPPAFTRAISQLNVSAYSYLKRDTHAPFETLAQTWHARAELYSSRFPDIKGTIVFYNHIAPGQA